MSGALRVRVRRRCQLPGPSLWVGPTEHTRGVEGNEYCIVTGTCLQPRPSSHPCLLVSPPVPHVTVHATLAPERARMSCAARATRARAHVGSAGARVCACLYCVCACTCVPARHRLDCQGRRYRLSSTVVGLVCGNGSDAAQHAGTSLTTLAPRSYFAATTAPS